MMEGYNGWTNYETWLVKLWMDNEQSSQQYYREIAKEAKSKYELSCRIEDEIKDGIPVTIGMYADLLTSALKSVNWYEIANSLWEDKE